MKLSTTGLRLSADAAIDLHLHTAYSDGKWAPVELLGFLAREEFSLGAICDHDRTDRCAEIQQLAIGQNIPMLVGVEISATWRGEMTDLLCYGFEPGKNALSALCEETFHRQQENTRATWETMRKQGYELPPGTLEGILEEPSSMQPHVMADRMVEFGMGKGEKRVGQILFDAGCEFALNDPATVVKAAHSSGAVCLLAHPGAGEGFVTYDADLLEEFLAAAPIDGLEIYQPKNNPEQTGIYREFALRNHMLISAGSDSHKSEKPPIKYRAELCRDLLERVGIAVG